MHTNAQGFHNLEMPGTSSQALLVLELHHETGVFPKEVTVF